MRRNVPWGFLAIYSILAMAYAATARVELDDVPVFWPRSEFWLQYWWLFVGGTIIVQLTFFLAHAALNRRLSVGRRTLWAIGILILGPLVIPLYWWGNSDVAT